MRKRYTAVLAVAAIASLALTACTKPAAAPGGDTVALPSDTTTAGPPVELNLVGFAVIEEAHKAAAAAWAQTNEGSVVTFKTSFGASGDQSRAVQNGQPADLVHFSVESDITRLVPDIIDPSWNTGPTKGIISSSIVVFGVRPGNPKNIKTWEDLAKPWEDGGPKIVTPDPASAGAARWNALAAWGYVISSGGTEEQASQLLRGIYHNAKAGALPVSGRAATTAFLEGTGDVFITYENEAILAKQSGAELDWVQPDTTLLIENPAAVTKGSDPRAQAYINFILSPAGQATFATKGYRPVGVDVDVASLNIQGVADPANPFPAPVKLLTIANTFNGDWKGLSTKFFDPDTGIITLIIQDSGL